MGVRAYGSTGVGAAAGALLSNGIVDIQTLVVREVASFHGELRVKGHAYWNEDAAGLAKFLPGATEVRVSFASPYRVPPLVVVTPEQGTDMDWWVSERTENGFVLSVIHVPEEDATFAWRAMAVEEPTLFVSDGTHGPAEKEYLWREAKADRQETVGRSRRGNGALSLR